MKNPVLVLPIKVKDDSHGVPCLCGKDCKYLTEHDEGMDVMPACNIFGILDGRVQRAVRSKKCVSLTRELDCICLTTVK